MDHLLKIVNLKRSSLLVFALLIVACGGGGGSADTDNSNNNSQQNTQIVDFSTKTDAEITALAGNAVIAGGAENETDEVDLNVGAGVIQTCDNVGGTLDHPAAPAIYGTYTFVDCQLVSSAIRLDGVFIYAQSTLAGFNDSFTFNNVKVIEGATTITFDGIIYVSETTNGNIEEGTVSTGSSPFTLVIASSKLNGTFTLTNFNENYTDDTNSHVTVSNTSYTVDSTVIGGKISVTTTVAVTHFYATEDYPRSGTYEITDGQGGKVVATIQGSGLATGIVNLQIDKDGDGIFESSNDVTWVEFAEKLS